MERNVRPIGDAQQRHLVVVETLEQAVEHRIAGRPGEDPIEADPWDAGALGIAVQVPYALTLIQIIEFLGSVPHDL